MNLDNLVGELEEFAWKLRHGDECGCAVCDLGADLNKAHAADITDEELWLAFLAIVFRAVQVIDEELVSDEARRAGDPEASFDPSAKDYYSRRFA